MTSGPVQEELIPRLLAIIVETFNRHQVAPIPCAVGSELISVPTDTLQSAANSYDPVRLQSSKGFVEGLLRNGVTPFLPVSLADGRILLPPIVEELDPGRHFLLDGTHRALAAIQQGVKRIYVVRLQMETSLPAPCMPHALTELWERDTRRYSKDELFADFKEANFRRMDWASGAIDQLLPPER